MFGRGQIGDTGIELISNTRMISSKMLQVLVALGDGEMNGVANGESDEGAPSVDRVDDVPGEGEEVVECLEERLFEFRNDCVEEMRFGAG